MILICLGLIALVLTFLVNLNIAHYRERAKMTPEERAEADRQWDEYSSIW